MSPAQIRTPEPAREYGLDALRVFAFAVLILYHSGMGYVSWTWHVKNPQTSEVLEWGMLFFNRWRLSLLFLISGAGVYFSLRRRTWSQFSLERIQRLLLPLAFSMFVIVPPQIWYEWLYRGRQVSYVEFYPTVFHFVSYPEGSTSWHHMWFVAYLLVYSLLGIPIFAALRSDAGQRVIARLIYALERWPLGLYLLTWPNILVGVTLGPFWPNTNNLVADWANLTGSFLTFLWGFVIASNKRFLDLITDRRREFLIAGISVAFVFFLARAFNLTQTWPPSARLWFWNIVGGYYGITWIFMLIGYARAYITRPNGVLRYATEAVYPFYIVHQTITVAVVYYMIPWDVSLWIKFVLAAVATFGGSWAVYECVRRVRALRPFFGLKAAARSGA